MHDWHKLGFNCADHILMSLATLFVAKYTRRALYVPIVRNVYSRTQFDIRVFILVIFCLSFSIGIISMMCFVKKLNENYLTMQYRIALDVTSSLND